MSEKFYIKKGKILINTEVKKPLIKKEFKGFIFNKDKNLLNNLNDPKEYKRIIRGILLLLYYIIIFLNFSILVVGCQQRNFQENYSYIILKTNGTGNIRIIGREDRYLGCMPNQIYINNNETNKIAREYYFENSANNINIFKLIWSEKINTTSNMFFICEKIIEIDLSHFDTSQVKDMSFMFCACYSLSSLNLSNFNTSQEKYMSYMFFLCSSLSSLNLSNFNTSQVKDMSSMFYFCSSLSSLNLSNFNTSQVKDMSYMFSECSSLSSLNLSNFDTSQVTSLSSMFNRCSSLIFLNLSNFDTSQVINMGSMFWECLSLRLLYLSNFDTSQVMDMNFIFLGCSNLEYINLKITGLLNITSKYRMIDHSSNLIICTEKEDWAAYFHKEKNINCHNINYGYNCYTNYLETIYNKYYCEMCGNNNKDYFMKYNDSNNSNSYINCYNYEEGYYLDEYDSLLKLCYKSCKSCNKSGNETEHNCIECNSDYTIEYQISNYKNCYEKVSDDSTDNIIINTFYPKSTEKITQININEDSHHSYELIDLIITDKSSKNEIETELIQPTSDNINNEFNFNNIGYILNKTLLEKNIEFILAKTNQNENNITINLGICEDLLKSRYNISKNDSLYIFQFFHFEVGMKIPKIEYEVYYPLYKNNLTKLNLSYCQGTKVEISIGVKITDIIDIHNASSDYYNDICYKTNSENGVDISLKKRRNIFIKNNMTLCEENCILIEYDYTKEKAKCSCDIKLSLPKNYDIRFNKDKFYKNFNKINNNIMKCSKMVWKIKELKKNYGFFIILFILLLYFLTLFIFWFKSNNKIMKDINYINYFLKRTEEVKNLPKIESKNETSNMIRIKNNKKRLKPIENRSINQINHINHNIQNNKNDDDNNLIVFKNVNKIKNSNYSEQIYQTTENKEIKNEKDINLGLQGLDNSYIKELLELKDFEMNSLDYEEAILLDQRNYMNYYISLLKYNHPIMLSFYPYIDYNSKIIKLFLFFFLFNLCLDSNVLFFNSNTIDKIYDDGGKYNFSYQIPQIIYSTLISKFIDSLIKYLALSQDNIVELKKEKKRKDFDNNYNLNYDRIKVCYTTHNPTEDWTLSDCSWDSITTYEQKTDTENKQYFYKYTYYPYFYSRYVLVQYTGTNPDGRLGAKASLSDIFDKLKDIVNSALSILAIIGIVIGSIIGFLLFLAGVCAVVICCLEKHNKGGLSINTKSSTDIEIPLAS